MTNTVITGSGSYIPEVEVDNISFIENPFCFDDGRRIQNDNQDVINKFQEITGIQARRYVNDSQSCSQIATIAAKRAIEDAGIEAEDIDMIIVAHNFGDVVKGSIQTDIVPSIVSVTDISVFDAPDNDIVALVASSCSASIFVAPLACTFKLSAKPVRVKFDAPLEFSFKSVVFTDKYSSEAPLVVRSSLSDVIKPLDFTSVAPDVENELYVVEEIITLAYSLFCQFPFM